MTLLEHIQTPADLKRLSPSQLQQLASEVRDRIIQVLSVTGGHLASNLGSIELTLALHYVFNAPQDRLIFDVSHQTYTHKLLTGRNNAQFDKIRCYKGLSGFAHPKESEHDHFFAGHAGTALSLALGMAKGRDIVGGIEHVIPIIGDATLTCGLSLEALNNITKDLSRFIVILNDNEMSISHNVGGIKHILSRLLSNPKTCKLAHELDAIVSKIPLCGSTLAEGGHRIAESMKNLVSSAPFFEQFGLFYIGPIDGHDPKKMVEAFTAIKDLPMPVIVHLFTKKGQGMKQAESDPITFHGVKPFDPKTCEFHPSPSKKPTFPKVFGKHIVELGEKNPRLALITPAMSLGSCLDPFKDRFPNRFFDVGIAEGHAVTFAGGLAKTEQLNVVCSIYSTFFQRALDNLFQDVCLQEIPVVFAVDRAGLATGDGATHHGIYEMSFLRAMPNMVICQPRNGQLLKELLSSSFEWGRPVAIRYPNLTTDDATEPLKERPLGKAEILAEGDDLIIVALGHQYLDALKLREMLLDKGISSMVVDPIFVKPLDTDLFGKLLLTHTRIVTLEEHSLKGGLGSEMNDFLLSHDFGHVQALNFGIPEAFIEQGSYHELLNELGLTPEKMVLRILAHFSFNTKKVYN
ncbi:1-deoxy-D-xylulose-5-phosphate synthase [Chlamydiota bacterium]